ncbi:MAG: MbnP family protein [Deinococcales bacterium]
MKKLVFVGLIGSVALLGLSSARNAMVEHALKVNLMIGKMPLELGKTYKTPGGADYQVDLLKFYTSNVQLVKADGSSQMVPGLSLVSFMPEMNAAGAQSGHNHGGGMAMQGMLEGGQMQKAKSTQNETFFSIKAPAGDYKGVRFEVGVPKEFNHRDASTLPLPLGLESGMFWSWNPGYIFFRLEGKVMVDGKAQPWLLHMGTDNWRMNVNKFDLATNKIKLTVDGKSSTVFNLDIEKLFSKGPNGAATWDLTNEKQRVMHGGPNVGQAYLNLIGAWDLQMQ